MNKSKRILFTVFGALLCLLWVSSCAAPDRFIPPRALPDDTEDIPQPQPRETYLAEDAFEYGFVQPTLKLFDISRHLRAFAGAPKQAMNVDAFGEVPDSSWFTNRNARRRMSLEEISRGPNRGTGPDMNGPWKIFSAKDEGFTVGFNIEDSLGDRYLLKFDPFGYLELSTSAEVIVTKIFHAAGYNVPENHTVSFHPSRLEMGASCVLYDELGLECEMTVDDFNRLLSKIQPLPDGRYLAMASKFLPGKPLGGFRYIGIRKDDPNDIVPHEHRRELRGLYVMCAWLKHFDIKDANSLDMYVEEDGRRFVKHYLLDFGSTLGSTSRGPMEAFRGKETEFDTGAAFNNLITLGLRVKPWEKAGQVPFPSIGRYSAEGFRPGGTKMNYNNPALGNLTNLDGYWGAKLVMSFTDEQLKILVREGRYSDPTAEASLLGVLKQRRDMTGRYWYSRVNPIDDFRVERRGEEAVLAFTDKGIEGRLWPLDLTQYLYSLHIDGQLIRGSLYLRDQTWIPVAKLWEFTDNTAISDRAKQPDSQWQLEFQVSRDQGRIFGKKVRLFFRPDPTENSFRLLGVEREN